MAAELAALADERLRAAPFTRRMAEWKQRGEVDSLSVYFDNTLAGHAFRNARALAKLFGQT